MEIFAAKANALISRAAARDLYDFSKIKRDLFPVLRKKDNFELEERKTQAKKYIADLMKITERESAFGLIYFFPLCCEGLKKKKSCGIASWIIRMIKY